MAALVTIDSANTTRTVATTGKRAVTVVSAVGRWL